MIDLQPTGSSPRGPGAILRSLFIALLVVLPGATSASGVLRTSFSELCSEAELILEGRVVSMEARKDSSTPFIWTHVTVSIVELIHGEFAGNEIELSFLGGTVGAQTLRVSQMTVPKIGEHGIYFVEKHERRQVHPLIGWQQGHFRIVEDSDGVERVTSADGRKIAGFESVSSPLVTGLSTGLPAGVQALENGPDSNAAMQPREFKAAIRVRIAQRLAPAR